MVERRGRLTGRVAIVTGAARGIGRAIAERMLGEGCQVALLDVLDEDLRRTCEQLTAAGGAVLGLHVDVARQREVGQAVKAAVERFGQVDILVNNAGIVHPGPLEDVQEKDWDAVVGVNLKGPAFCAQAVAPFMKQRRYGRIVNIGSRAALGKQDRTVYSATKAGLLGLTRTWALELAPFGITVNWIGPGLIETELGRAVNPDGERTRRLVAAIPLQRVGEPEDVANAVAFFASDDASFVTGQTLFVCGGLSIESARI